MFVLPFAFAEHNAASSVKETQKYSKLMPSDDKAKVYEGYALDYLSKAQVYDNRANDTTGAKAEYYGWSL